MRAELQAAVSLLVGIVTLRLSLSRLYLDFVKPSMRPWLIASGCVLVVFGAMAFLRATRAHEHDVDAHGHDDHHVPKAAWLLILPALLLLLITPNPLGSFAAGRQATVRIDPSSDFDPLPLPKGGAVQISVSEFVDRALYDEKRSLKDVPVRLTGFVTASEGTGEFYLTRFVISCCAADARSSRVAVFGKSAPPVDSWITVTGTWRPPAKGKATDAEMTVKTLKPIPQPEVPYESY